MPSALVAAELGVGVMHFPGGPLEQYRPIVDAYRETFSSKHGKTANPPVMVEFVYCSRDDGAAREARQYLANETAVTVDHYFTDTDFVGVKGYETAANVAAAVKGPPPPPGTKTKNEIVGSPEEIVDEIRERTELLGQTVPLFVFRYGGMPFEMAEESMRLVANEVLPSLREAASATVAS
jgi:alkanesulfonate monooxygenase SsuD/methylene tetrahydromethanopterin reductase-like flavin-dependent oxidoreductase (luciferase family)